MNRLENKIALITGSARGIGAACARLFIQEGASVILSDILDEQGYALAESLGPRARYLNLEVSDENAWQSTCDYITAQFGRLDILINNAGVCGLEQTASQDPEHLALDDWRLIHKINLDSVFLGCKYGIRLMKQHGGAIVNMSSRSGLVGVPQLCAYASSKAAIRNHSKSVALYCAAQGYAIRCNSIHPAAILTPLWDPILGTDDTRAQKQQALCDNIPLGQMGTPEDVAYASLYLASDEARYITGSELTLDGGILAGSNAAPHTQNE